MMQAQHEYDFEIKVLFENRKEQQSSPRQGQATHVGHAVHATQEKQPSQKMQRVNRAKRCTKGFAESACDLKNLASVMRWEQGTHPTITSCELLQQASRVSMADTTDKCVQSSQNRKTTLI